MAARLRALRDDIVAGIMLLTRLPMPSLQHFDASLLSRSVWTYPLVGALVGAVGAAVFIAARAVGFDAGVASWLSLAATVLSTGAFHEDGLADFWDGIGGGATRARKLEIMRDSRIGSYGAVALILAIGCKAQLVGSIAANYGDGAAALALISAGMAGRAAIIAVLLCAEPAQPDGLGTVAGDPPALAAIAGLLSLVLMVPLAGAIAAAGAILAVILSAFLMALFMRSQLDGYTGDGLGATVIKCELVALAIMGAVGLTT